MTPPPPTTPHGDSPPPQLRPPWTAIALIGALVVVAVVFVASSLRGPELEWYPVTAADPEEAGDTLSVQPRKDTKSEDRPRY